jgi:starch synthase
MDRASGREDSPYRSNLSLFEARPTESISDEEVKREITLAFSDYRAFPFFPSDALIDRIKAGESAVSLSSVLADLRDKVTDDISKTDSSIQNRLKRNVRLGSRIVNALFFVHMALAEIDNPQLQRRRFVLVKEVLGLPTICYDRSRGTVIARVGQGAHWAEIPTIYLGMNLFDTLAYEQNKNEEKHLKTFKALLLIEERAIETGYSHIEKIPDDVLKALDAFLAEVMRVSALDELEYILVPERRAKRFSKRSRQNYLRLLNKSSKRNEAELDVEANLRAVLSLQRLARRYNSGGDRRSLREVMRLLVAASGHDVHAVRNRANIVLERIFSPKEFDAPLATRFINVRRGTSHTFEFDLPVGKHRYFIRLYSNNPHYEIPLEEDISSVDIELKYDKESGRFKATKLFEELGHFDYLVHRKGIGGVRWLLEYGCSGRVNVIPDIRGEIVLEVFPDIHGHTRIYWDDRSGHPGLVYNEHGEVIRLGRFSDITAHLEDLKDRYQITSLYLLGVQRRGANREDWAPEASSPSPFSPMSLTEIEPLLGGEREFKDMVARAHELDVKVIIDVVPHVNRSSTSIPDDFVVRCYNDSGDLVTRASTDGQYGSWNDGKLLNYRKFEVWQWIAKSVLALIDRFDIDGIRFDSAHAMPIMMKKNNYPYTYGRLRSNEEMVEGTIIVNDREDDHFITTGYYDSGCRDIIACPFHYYLMQSIERKLKARAKSYFIYLAECYWGREQVLARTGIIPYNSALFKICEKIIHGLSDVREIYHLYDWYFPSALPPGTELLGILGNHDERRALNTFGHRGLRAAIGLTCFMSNIIMDYEGSAEGEGWKVFLDNIYVNWNQFESAAYRSFESFYRETYSFHREKRGSSFLLWAGNNMVAASIRFTDEAIWLGAFNFSDTTQNASIQFDKPGLPIEDSAFYSVSDPLYSPLTGKRSYFTGRELRVSKLNTVVAYTDRIKLLKIEKVEKPQSHYHDFLRDSLDRLCEASRPEQFPSSFSFLEIASGTDTAEGFASFIETHLLPLFREEERYFLELSLKRALFYIYKRGIRGGAELLELIQKLSLLPNVDIKNIAGRLQDHYRYRPIVFISAEAEPFSKSGGLANVVYELPRELASLGEKVYVITPYYRTGDEKAIGKMKRAVKEHGVAYTGLNVRFKIQEAEYQVGVHTGKVEGITYFLLDHHEFFDGLYWGYTAEEKLRRRVALARASVEVIVAFGLEPHFTLTNDAYAGIFNGIVRSNSYYRDSPNFKSTTFLHIIHNGGWQYFDSYYRYEKGFDHFLLFNLPQERAVEFSDPCDPYKINCMAAGIRFADRVITVSPSYAEQIETACDGLEVILHDVIGMNNALGRDFHLRLEEKFKASGFVDETHPRFLRQVDRDAKLRRKIQERFPELLQGAHHCESIEEQNRREILVRMRNKLLLQLQRGLKVDPDRILFSMIHRLAEQKGFQLLLEASEFIFKELGFQGIVGGQPASGDQRGQELARGLRQLADYYPGQISVDIGFVDVSIPLLSSDVFLMPSMQEPGGISQLEALACECLVVARATGGLRDTITPLAATDHRVTGNGFLFSDYTPQALCDAMKRCAEFFRCADQNRLSLARRNAHYSVPYWDRSSREYIDRLYGIKEIIRCV